MNAELIIAFLIVAFFIWMAYELYTAPTINEESNNQIQTNMETKIPIDMTLQEAKGLHKTADNIWKGILERKFGKKHFSADILDRIGDFNDICLEVGTTEEEFKEKHKSLSPFSYANEKMDLINTVLNDGWVADYDNSSQVKWYAVFTEGKSGFAFRDSIYDYGFTYTCSGARLAWKNERTSDFAAITFPDVFKAIFIK